MTLRRALFIEHQTDAHPGYLGDRAVERGIEVVVHSPADGAFPDPVDYSFVVVLGSDDSVTDPDLTYGAQDRALLRRAIDREVPVLGVCFGAQLLSQTLGGDVQPMASPEIGWYEVETDDPELIETGPWLTWHFDSLTTPPGAVEVARTPRATQAFIFGPHVGVQFHPEATPSSVAAWVRTYRDAILASGQSLAELSEESRRRASQARAAAHRLLDRFIERIPAGSRH